jgi:hypothetical protein
MRHLSYQKQAFLFPVDTGSCPVLSACRNCFILPVFFKFDSTLYGSDDDVPFAVVIFFLWTLSIALILPYISEATCAS